MKQAVYTTTMAALALFALPAAVSATETIFTTGGFLPAGIYAPDDHDQFDRRGRKRPRVPGGSGCDDPRDLIEHPECRL